MNNSQNKPSELPRFAESFRVFIDRDQNRLLTGEWTDGGMFPKTAADFCPHLAKSGELGFIARTLPAGVDQKTWYGDRDVPVIHWHWKDGAWQMQATSEMVVAFCAHKNVATAVFHLPRYA